MAFLGVLLSFVLIFIQIYSLYEVEQEAFSDQIEQTTFLGITRIYNM